MNYELLTKTPSGWLEQLDLDQYAIRQAQSCDYLEKTFSSINPQSLELENLFSNLLNVHRRQYDDLSSVVDVPAVDGRKSFYFDQMYGHFGLSTDDLSNTNGDDLLTILSIQAVSYLRGEDRYVLLKDENIPYSDVWNKFYQDAGSNAKLVFEFLDSSFYNCDNKIREVVKVEDELIHKIWRHKK
jgi:hypothetical protein